jgi:hypothetical protein
MPSGLRSLVSGAIGSYEGLDESQRSLFVQLIAEEYKPSYPAQGPDLSKLVSTLRVTKDEASALFTLATLVSIGITLENNTAEEFVDAVFAAEVMSPDSKNAMTDLVNRISEIGDVIGKKWRVIELSQEHLPVLESFELGVDLRLGFKDEKLDAVVPVVLAYVDTDAFEKDLHFQMTRDQVEKLVEELTSTLAKLSSAEELSKKLEH